MSKRERGILRGLASSSALYGTVLVMMLTDWWFPFLPRWVWVTALVVSAMLNWLTGVVLLFALFTESEARDDR